VNVADDFSHSGPRTISFAPAVSDTVRVMQVQQRLNYLGYLDRDGDPLPTDGLLRDATRRAIDVFNGAVAGSSVAGGNNGAVIGQLSPLAQGYINSALAPRWVRLNGGAHWSVKDPLPKGDRWATDWVRNAIDRAAARLPADHSNDLV